MTVNEIKEILDTINDISFQLPNGELVPKHFHVTEVGRVQKDYIDCGGTLRNELTANFQLWTADDHDHRLAPSKLLDILSMAQDKLGLGNFNIEVEYQGDTIGRYGLDYDGKNFNLISTMTDCLAKDNCGIPEKKVKVDLGSMIKGNSCDPNSGCC